MPVRVHLAAVRPTMRLARPVCDAEGKLVAGTGTLLRDGIVRALRRLALQTVLIEDDEVARWDTVRPLAEELADLDGRFGTPARDEPLAALKEAIARRLRARAAQVAADDTES